jgi:predicted nucleotidyltransferase
LEIVIQLIALRLARCIAGVDWNLPGNRGPGRFGGDKNRLHAQYNWQWRYKLAELVAWTVDFSAYGIKGMYIIGSVKTAEAAQSSDIDLLIHVEGTVCERGELVGWLGECDSLCKQLYELQTGKTFIGELIDHHLITDKDIEERNSYAVMLDSLHNSATPLRLL